MKIAIISPWAIKPTAVGGTERYIIDLAEGLIGHGHSVTVFMLSGGSYTQGNILFKSLDLLNNEKIATEYDLQETLGSFTHESSFNKLARFAESKIHKDTFDIFHINSLLFLEVFPNERRIFTIHTNPYEYQLDWGSNSYEKMIQLLSYEATKPKTKLVAPSQHYANLFATILKSPVTYIPHAIDVTRVASSANSDELYKKYGIDSTKTTLLLPSRLEPAQKRPQIAFEAVAQLPTTQRAQIQIVASGLDSQYLSFKERLEQIASKANFSSRFIRFDRMSDAYAIADIIGLPSHSESFGYAALESLSLGKPTILNSIPPFRELGDNNPHAYFFDDTAEAFTQALVKVLSITERDFSVASEWSATYEIDQWISSYESIMRI